MADPRVFTLIGNFDDNISKHLVAINQNLAKVKASLEEVSKATKPLKTDFRQLASLSQNFNTSLKSQASDIRDVTKAMRAMRNEMGRVNRAYRAGGRNAGQDARRFAPPPPPPPPRTPRFRTPPPPPPPPRTPTPRTPEYAGPPPRRGGYAAAAGATVGGAVLGTQLGDIITNSIVRGFQMGVNIMTVPFKYAANAFGERVRDEMSDLQSAGGLFATDIRYNLKMFKSFNEARRAQEDINARLAKSAAELPGETAQYVREAKRITDTMIGAMGRNQESFMKYAQSIGAKTGDKEDALATVIQKFTEKSVLLGMQPGGGGSRSIYGIPQLMEILVNQPNANLKSMSYKYAALRDNPLLANALQQGEAKINATAAGTAERLAAIMEILDQALPNEVVSAMRNSTDGVIQSIKSAFLDPEVGLFGLGRKLSGVVVPRVDALGRYLDKSGKVVEDASLAAKDQISLFGLFRDTLAGFVVPLNGLISILPQIYDPLKAIGLDMLQMRDISQRFLATFNGFTKGFEELGNKLKSYNIRSTASARGGLLTFANLLQNIGKIDTKQFQEYSRQLQDRNADLGKIAKSIFSELFDSKFMKMLGEMIGNIVGGTLKTLGDLMAGVTNIAQTGPFAEGLKKGWDASGGSQGIANIFKSLFRVIGNLIFQVITSAPMESAIVAGLFLLPSAISGLITSAITAVLTGGQSFMVNALRKAVMNIFKVKPVVVEDLGPRITDPRRQLPAATGATRQGAIVTQTTGTLVKFNKVLNSFMSYVKGIGPRFAGFFKGFLGKLSIFGAVITSVISLFQGKDLAQALAEGAGPLLGAALGSALIPFLGPIGPMLGAAVGGWIGSLEAVTTPLAQTFESIGYTFQVTFDALVQIGGDLLGIFNGLAGILPGVGEGFNLLKFALFALLSPFRLLELGIRGLYVLYLQMKSNLGLASKEERDKLEREKTTLAQRTTQFVIEGDEARGVSKQQQLQSARSELARLEAKRQAKTGTYRGGQRSGSYSVGPSQVEKDLKLRIQMLEKQVAAGKGGAPAPTAPVKPAATKPGTPAKTAAPAAPAAPVAPAVSPKLEAAAQNTAMQTQSLNAKAATQINHAAATQKTTEDVKKNTTSANTILNNIKSATIAVSNRVAALQTAMLGDLNNIQAGVSSISTLLQSGSLKVKTDFAMPGGLPGGGNGGPSIYGAAASKFGLTMTSGYRPGDKGYHGINRARDYSNGSGPTPQMLAFAQYMYSTFGRNLKELIYTPLGYSIKDGKKVPPYAQSTHYDHVHVAWAFGPNNPVGFGSMQAAQQWERSMVPGSLKVASVTANSGEGFGTTINGGINVTVNAGNVSDADELAAIVALKIGEAVSDARAASIFV